MQRFLAADKPKPHQVQTPRLTFSFRWQQIRIISAEEGKEELVLFEEFCGGLWFGGDGRFIDGNPVGAPDSFSSPLELEVVESSVPTGSCMPKTQYDELVLETSFLLPPRDVRDKRVFN